MPTLLHGPDVTWESGRGFPLVVHYWADLQLVHRLRCYGNITRTRNVSEYSLALFLVDDCEAERVLKVGGHLAKLETLANSVVYVPPCSN